MGNRNNQADDNQGKITPAIEARIRALRQAGKTQAEIAREVGVSQPAVSVFLRRDAPIQPAKPAPAQVDNNCTPTLASRLTVLATELSAAGAADEAATIFEAAARLSALDVASEPDDDDDLEELPTEPLEILRRTLRQAQRDADQWAAVGNASGASRAQRTVAMLAPQVAKLERAEREGDGMVHISRAEIAAAHERNRVNLKRLLDRPLLCADCGRALSAQMAGAGEAP